MGAFVFGSPTGVITAAVVLLLASATSPAKDAPVYEYINGDNHTTFLLQGWIQVVLTYPATSEGGQETATLNLSGSVPAISQTYVNSTVSGQSYLSTYLTWSEGVTLAIELIAEFSINQQWWMETVSFSFSSPSPLLPNSTVNGTGHLRENYEDLFMTTLGKAYTCAQVTFDLPGENVNASAIVVIDDFEVQGYSFAENGVFSSNVISCPEWSLARDLAIPIAVFLLLILVGAVAISMYVIGMTVHQKRTRKYRTL